MSGDMKEAFKKAGYKEPDTKPVSPAQSQPANQTFNLDKNYAAQAEQVIVSLKQSMGRDYQNFTTSKIRNILALVSEIYNDVNVSLEEVLSPELQDRIEYLKVRLVYECGREPKPRVIDPFVKRAGLLDLLNHMGDSRENFIKFARYMEALVAYHRFHGGRDN